MPATRRRLQRPTGRASRGRSEARRTSALSNLASRAGLPEDPSPRRAVMTIIGLKRTARLSPSIDSRRVKNGMSGESLSRERKPAHAGFPKWLESSLQESQPQSPIRPTPVERVAVVPPSAVDQGDQSIGHSPDGRAVVKGEHDHAAWCEHTRRFDREPVALNNGRHLVDEQQPGVGCSERQRLLARIHEYTSSSR